MGRKTLPLLRVRPTKRLTCHEVISVELASLDRTLQFQQKAEKPMGSRTLPIL